MNLARAASALLLAATTSAAAIEVPLPSCVAQSPEVLTPPPGDGNWTAGLVKNQVLATVTPSRRFHYYVPANIASPGANRALVVYLHGGTLGFDDAIKEAGASSEWLDIADEEGLVVLFPNGTQAVGENTAYTWDDSINVTGSNQHWNDCRDGDEPGFVVDDVAFLDALIGWALNPARAGDAKPFSVRADRVYVVGSSNGGIMSYRMATQSTRGLQGVAAFIAGLPSQPEAGCNPDVANLATPRVPMFISNGTADEIMKWDGGIVNGDIGGVVMSAQHTLDRWVRYGNFQSATADLSGRTPVTTQYPNVKLRALQGNNADGSYICSGHYAAFHAGGTGKPVRLYRVEGGGHAEPSLDHEYSALFEAAVGKQNQDVEGMRAAWTFFESLQGP